MLRGPYKDGSMLPSSAAPTYINGAWWHVIARRKEERRREKKMVPPDDDREGVSCSSEARKVKAENGTSLGPEAPITTVLGERIHPE